MNTRRYKLHTMLDGIDDASSWPHGKFSCLSCRKRYVAPSFETSVGNLCAACVEREFKKASRQENLVVWPISRFIEALQENGKIRDRLTVLWKFHDVLRYTEAKYKKQKPLLLQCLIKNLGFIQEHPLAQAVRQSAYQACVAVGEPVVPLLLEMCQTRPWQFYANVVMALGMIAPDMPEVQDLIAKAAQDTNSGVRGRAEAFLRESQAEPLEKKDILHTVIRKLDPSLRKFVKVGMDARQVKQKLETISSSRKRESYIAGQKRIEETLLQYYTADALKKIYASYIHDRFSEDEFPESRLQVNRLKKKKAAWMIARVFADTALFEKLVSFLSEEVKSILHQLVWEGGEHDVELLENTFQTEIVKSVDIYGYSSASQDIRDPYSIFLVRREYRYYYSYDRKESPYKYYLYLLEPLRKLFKQQLSPPAEYDLIPFETIEETAFVYGNGDRILPQLPLFYSYIDQGHVKLAKTTGKVLKNSLKQMAKYCHIEEFYDRNQKELAYLRATLLIDFCRTVVPEQPLDNSPDSLKQVFQEFFSQGEYPTYRLCELLSHLQGIRYVTYYNGPNEQTVRNSVQTLLKLLPVRQWFLIDHLIQYCIYRDLSLDIVDRYSAGRSLTFRKHRPQQSYPDDHASVTGNLYKDVVLVPLMKSIMFLLAAFGIVDIAYDEPENPLVQQTNKPYLSLFDGGRYIRLTPLGAYVIGAEESYESIIEEETAQATLDENRLFITLDGKDRLKSLILDTMADKISDVCYKVNYQTFLKDCLSTHDIEHKIAQFHEHISADPPPIWQEFLDDVLAKINPISAKQQMTVYELKPNKELITLVARDDVLKQYVLKAEKYHVVIDAKHLPKVRKRLEEFGYFIDNL